MVHRIWLATVCGLACGCAARGLPPGDATAATKQYVIEHRAALEREIQVGSGEALYELSKVADCRDLSALNRALRKKRAEIFTVPPPSDPDVADRIVVLLRENPELVCLELETGPNRPFASGRHHVLSGVQHEPRPLRPVLYVR
jgi:hypothetical protein